MMAPSDTLGSGRPRPLCARMLEIDSAIPISLPKELNRAFALTRESPRRSVTSAFFALYHTSIGSHLAIFGARPPAGCPEWARIGTQACCAGTELKSRQEVMSPQS
jgi:hypothetical protein